jgi:hypothetical protein
MYFKLLKPAFILMITTLLLSPYGSAAPITYKCDGFSGWSGWIPREFSVTLNNGDYGWEVKRMTSNNYTYDLDKIDIKKVSQKLVHLYYKSSNKTSTGGTVNVRHTIYIYPKSYLKDIRYEVSLPGGQREKSKGYCN